MKHRVAIDDLTHSDTAIKESSPPILLQYLCEEEEEEQVNYRIHRSLSTRDMVIPKDNNN